MFNKVSLVILIAALSIFTWGCPGGGGKDEAVQKNAGPPTETAATPPPPDFGGTVAFSKTATPQTNTPQLKYSIPSRITATSYSYDDYGKQSAIRKSTLTNEFNDKGQIRKSIYFRDSTQTGGSLQFTYDESGRVSKVLLGLDATLGFQYDVSGMKQSTITISHADGESEKEIPLSYVYDGKKRMLNFSFGTDSISETVTFNDNMYPEKWIAKETTSKGTREAEINEKYENGKIISMEGKLVTPTKVINAGLQYTYDETNRPKDMVLHFSETIDGETVTNQPKTLSAVEWDSKGRLLKEVVKEKFSDGDKITTEHTFEYFETNTLSAWPIISKWISAGSEIGMMLLYSDKPEMLHDKNGISTLFPFNPLLSITEPEDQPQQVGQPQQVQPQEPQQVQPQEPQQPQQAQPQQAQPAEQSRQPPVQNFPSPQRLEQPQDQEQQ